MTQAAAPKTVCRQTVGSAVTFTGVGVHTGASATVRVQPADPGMGVVFLCEGGKRVPATVESVTDCRRSTVLGPVSTVEHLLAAVSSLQLSDLLIEVEGPEIPILDGSARPFYEALQQAGIRPYEQKIEMFHVKHPVIVAEGQVLVMALPAEEPVFEYALDYAHPLLGYQHVEFRPSPGNFRDQLAPARTFALWEEVQPLWDKGLAKGGSLENALVVYQDRYSTPLRLELEPVRHKCLDLVGDVSLFGRPIVGRILAVRAGHRWHVELVRRLRQEESLDAGQL